jgi:hypothetical protein
VKQRLLTLALGLGALLLFYQLFLPKPPPEFARPSEPLSTDSGPDGELAMWRWLNSQGIPVSSLRLRYDQLASAVNGATGNVLLTVMPHQLPLRNDEWSPLTKWIASGNTLLVLAALDDTPRWSLGRGPGFILELQRLTRVAFSVTPENPARNDAGDLRQMLKSPDIRLEPRGAHALLADVRSVHASSDLAASRWQGTPQGHDMPFELMQRADDDAPAMWLAHHGAGQMIVLMVASAFSNREIDQADNARLLANVIAWSRAPQGRVIFDDAHQGSTDYYDARAFFADPRLHRTLWWLVALWLAFVLGPLPLRSAFSSWRPVDETLLIEASGRFYSNAVTRVDAARRLLENFFNRLRRRLNLPENGAPLWEWIDSQAAVSSEQRALLQSLFAKVYAQERVDLAKLQNLLTDIQGRLA